jgi:hypothetical protein
MNEASSESEAEEAKDFAADHLILLVALSSLMRERPISKDLIFRFAEQQRIAPGIVVAQLQKHRRLVPMTPLNKLKVTHFDLTVVERARGLWGIGLRSVLTSNYFRLKVP